MVVTKKSNVNFKQKVMWLNFTMENLQKKRCNVLKTSRCQPVGSVVEIAVVVKRSTSNKALSNLVFKEEQKKVGSQSIETLMEKNWSEERI